MRQIAGEVGVQAGALYNYTTDKQSLLFDLMKGHMDELLVAWSEEPDTRRPDGRAGTVHPVPHPLSFQAPRGGVHLLHGTAQPEPREFCRCRRLAPRLRRCTCRYPARRGQKRCFRCARTQGGGDGRHCHADWRQHLVQRGRKAELSEVEEIYWDMVRKTVTA